MFSLIKEHTLKLIARQRQKSLLSVDVLTFKMADHLLRPNPHDNCIEC
jgi:hypothetical protein